MPAKEVVLRLCLEAIADLEKEAFGIKNNCSAKH